MSDGRILVWDLPVRLFHWVLVLLLVISWTTGQDGGIDAMTWRGLGLEAALAPTAVMLAFSALFAAVALWRFRWDE